MSRVEIRDLGEPEAVVTYPLGATYQVRLAGTVVSHHVLQLGGTRAAPFERNWRNLGRHSRTLAHHSVA